MKSNNRSILIIFGFLFLANLIAGLLFYDLNKNYPFEVTFFDVGQGDAIFIETPKRQQILIDGGPGSKVLEKLDKEMPFYDRSLDLVILTHPESDHTSGLIEVLRRYKVENILWTGIIRNTSQWREWESLIEKELADIKIAEFGQRIIFDNNLECFQEKEINQTEPCAYLDILYPFDNLKGQIFEKSSNDTSIVARLVLGENEFLFTGDIEKKVEAELAEENIVSHQEVLKVAHHGSKTSTSREFLAKVQPKIAVVQVGGNNKYGHPHSETLANLSEFGIEVFRTDIDGDIKIVSQGNELKLNTSRN